MDNVLRPFIERVSTESLSKSEEGVHKSLAPIFPHLNEKQLKAVVLYQASNFYGWVDEPGLLQHCITFILDNQDIVQSAAAASTASSKAAAPVSRYSEFSDVIDVFSDDDDSVLLGAVSLMEAGFGYTNNNKYGKYADKAKSKKPPCLLENDLPAITPPRQWRQKTTPKQEQIIITDSPDVLNTGGRSYISISSTEDTSLLSDLKQNSIPAKTVPNVSQGHDVTDLDLVSYVPDGIRKEHGLVKHKTTVQCFDDLDDIDDLPCFDDLLSDIRPKTEAVKNVPVSDTVIGPVTTHAQGNQMIQSHLGTHNASVSNAQTSSNAGTPIKPAHFGPSSYPKTNPGVAATNVTDVIHSRHDGLHLPYACPPAPVGPPYHYNFPAPRPPNIAPNQYHHPGPFPYQPPNNMFPSNGPYNLHQAGQRPTIVAPKTNTTTITVNTSAPKTDTVRATIQTDSASTSTSSASARAAPAANTSAASTHSATNPPELSPKKSVDQNLEDWKQEVLQVFPNVEQGYLEGRLRAHYGPWAVNNVCSEFLENPNYPCGQVEKVAEEIKEPPKVASVDHYKEWDKTECSVQEHEEALKLLQGEFRRVRANDVREVLSMYKGHYAPAYKVFEDAMKEAYSKLSQQGPTTSKSPQSHSVKEITLKYQRRGKTHEAVSKLLKTARHSRPHSICHANLLEEVDFVKRKKVEQKEKEDYEMAWKLNEAQYEEDGQTIECGCCFCEYPFESMVQCTDGHLFCSQCLLNYAKEAIFGSGKLTLICMTTGCGASYPHSELSRALPREILGQYEERSREESLNLANLEDLVRCPHCNYAAIMDVKTDKVFRCQNRECLKETCRLCKEDWKDHVGLPCEKVEKKDETRLRKEYEEKMTEAKVRMCHQCRSKFTKEEGCNKMTCTCRATMCYICRKPNIDYNHFCRHPRDPGKLCDKCKACSLWTNPDEDDKRAIEEIQKEAHEKRKEIGFTDDKMIGVVEPPAPKKPRRR